MTPRRLGDAPELAARGGSYQAHSSWQMSASVGTQGSRGSSMSKRPGDAEAFRQRETDTTGDSQIKGGGRHTLGPEIDEKVELAWEGELGLRLGPTWGPQATF